MKPLLVLLLLPFAARANDAVGVYPEEIRAEKQEKKAALLAIAGTVVPILPPKYALDSLQPQTFGKWPYRDGDAGYINADTRGGAFQAYGAAQAVVNGGVAKHVEAHLRLEGRIGGDFAWSQYESRALGTLKASDFLRVHVLSSLLEREDLLFETGLGFATLQRDVTKHGASWAFNLEVFRRRPWLLSARYEPTILLDGRFYHDLRADVGANYGPVGLTVGFRAFLNPLRNALGPEAALKVWLF